MDALSELIASLENSVPVEVKYSAVFDPRTGKVTSVGPSTAFVDETNKIEIDNKIRIRYLYITIPKFTLIQ